MAVRMMGTIKKIGGTPTLRAKDGSNHVSFQKAENKRSNWTSQPNKHHRKPRLDPKREQAKLLAKTDKVIVESLGPADPSKVKSFKKTAENKPAAPKKPKPRTKATK